MTFWNERRICVRNAARQVDFPTAIIQQIRDRIAAALPDLAVVWLTLIQE